jgi:hypothetical protein
MGLADIQQAELGTLVAGAVRAVVEAQATLDEEARQRTEMYLEAPAGSLVLPPLWYAFQSVVLELELSAAVHSVAADQPHAGGASQLLCRTVNPTTVGLFGYEAASGMTVRVVIAPRGIVPAKPVESIGPEEPA